MNGIPDPVRASKAVEIITESATLPEGQMFKFGDYELRSWLIDGEPWFLASDVAIVLRYRMASDMTRRLDDDEKGTRSVRTPGGPQNVSIINESGLYTAILGSRTEGAQDFKRWVTKRVLPEIRKTGTYAAPAASAPLAPPTHSEALRGWAAEIEAREQAESRARELAVPASAWNELAEAAGDYSVADAAKVLSRDTNISTGERRLFKQMQGLGWIYRRNGHWSAYQTQVSLGRLVEKVNQPFIRNGESVAPAPTIRITTKGLQELHKRLGGREAQLTLAVAE